MLAVAQTYVKGRAVAEEVVQEAWLGVIKGLDRFEGRSSLKTWILSILVNQAKTRGVREARSVPFTALAPEGEEPAVDPGRFRGAGRVLSRPLARVPRRLGPLRRRPRCRTARRCASSWARSPSCRTRSRRVIRMRDVEGYSSEEVCDALDVSEGNQRVLLHRARSRVRAALEGHFDA